MKILYTIILLLLIPTYGNTTENLTHMVVKDIHISKCGLDCIEVETRNDLKLRVYSCGRVELLKWEEIIPNKDTMTTIEYLYIEEDVYDYSVQEVIK